MFKFYRARVRNAAKYLRKNYYKSKVESLEQTNPRKWWRITKQLLGQSHTSDSMYKSLAQSSNITNYQDLANKINEFYQSFSSHLPPLNVSSLPECSGEIPSKYIIDIQTVERKLAYIDCFKSPGPDALPNWIIRDFFHILAPPVCAIFNSSIREGVVPLLWKSANVVSLAKVSPPKSI
jgi:hypothetical protein